RGQVAHVDVPARWSDDVGRRLNGVLAPDVRVHRVTVAPDGFDARFSALSRRYSYRVADGGIDPLRRHDTMTYRGHLDLDIMNAAAQRMLGMHDFAAFCRKREGATTVRTLLALEWVRDDAGVAVARVEADAFCRSMVRSLVGSLLEVGDPTRDRVDAGWLMSVLAGRERAGAAAVAPPHGLTLEEVCYPPPAHMRARADQARQRRDTGSAEA
ncbi:MAG TPA: tRNA pseudouridine(38-40) synthase TruA, partial [Acidothermaceae bacterium]